jgi:hypothetical protein
MNYLLDEDLNAAVAALSYKLKLAMEKKGDRVFVAGGFLRAIVAREPVNDIDVFSESTVDQMGFLAMCMGDEKIHTTPNAFSIDTKPSIQIIRNWNFPTARACIDSFDFSICQAAIWYSNHTWRSVCSENFYADLAARRLRYNSNNRNAVSSSSMVRLLKFYERGYVTSGDSLASIVRDASRVEVSLLEGEKKPITRTTRTY